MHLFSPNPLDSIVKEHLYDDWDQYSGMNLFVEEWADQLTAQGAADVINTFGLQSELGFPDRPLTANDVVQSDDAEEGEGRYTDVSAAFHDIRAALDETSIKRLNQDSELATPEGPSYAAGQDGLRFGLTFEASWDDLQKLREEYPKRELEPAEASTRKASTDTCIQQAINYLNQVDFGFETAEEQTDPTAPLVYQDLPGIDLLHKAQEELLSCGIDNVELAKAIRSYRTHRDQAESLIHGPSGMGTNKGVLNDLIEMVAAVTPKRGTMSFKPPQFVRYAGMLYERVDNNNEVREAYHLPKKMKGVKPCTPKDQTDEEPKEQQVWCVFDWKNNLRARYKSRKKALQYKVFMINRGKGGGK